MKTGVFLSILAIVLLFLDIPQVVAFAGKAQIKAQYAIGNDTCGTEDESEDDGKDSPNLASFIKNHIPTSAANVSPIRPCNIADRNHSPSDFPPESDVLTHANPS